MIAQRGRVRFANLLAIVFIGGCAHAPRAGDPLAAGFATPPPTARPYVWWHWMNGNVSAEGAERDLRWMHSAGIGGVQLFEGALDTPRVVDPPLLWSTPAWRDAVRRSAITADALGLDLAIASSPGWSATGAPFVQPADAMKKLVWSEATVEGGRPVGRLAPPPDTAGPFQDVATASSAKPRWYADVAVLAFPGQSDPLPTPTIRLSGRTLSNETVLRDGSYAKALDVPIAADGTAVLDFDFGRDVPVGAFTLGLSALLGFGAPPPPKAGLSVSADGRTYREVTTLAPNAAQVRAAGFDPMRVRHARLRLSAPPGGGGPPVGKGVVPLPAAPTRRSFAITEARFDSRPHVDRWPEKAGFATLPDYYAVPTRVSKQAGVIGSGTVVDVTRHLQGDGSLDWTPPPGRWTVLRLGASLTGKTNGPAPTEATGLEVDKLDADAVGRYAKSYLQTYERAVGSQLLGGRGIRSLLSDSIEAGNQNWTPGMLAAFRGLRGYDPLPWLPALTGRIVGDARASDRFLWDYRRTIADLLQDAHYGTLAKEAHARGMTYYAEALEDHRPQLGDDLAMRARADVPMGAFWWSDTPASQRPTLLADVQGAASVANIYGKAFVGAESFTAFGRPWSFAPRDLKATADHGFALGVNRVMIHTSAHQPIESAAPGFALSPLLGQYFSRTETWAGMARGWTDYLARAAWLLQQGRHAADIAYFIGEEAPVTALYGDRPFDGVPQGYGFDFVGSEGLNDHLRVAEDGTLVSSGGVRYRALMLGGSSARVTLRTLRRLRTLVDAGASLVGTRPVDTPSLSDGPAEWRAAADAIWGDGSLAVQTLGKGRVFARLADMQATGDLPPDWQATGTAGADLVVQHRTSPTSDIWFIFNKGAAAFEGEVSLRGDRHRPEKWDAVDGSRRPMEHRQADGRTSVPLTLAPSGSIFIVMRRTTGRATGPKPASRPVASLDVRSGWRLRLGEAGAAEIALSRLQSWTDFTDADRRYFSGVGTYRTTIEVPAGWAKRRQSVRLDLGEVGDVAEVRVNGAAAGIVWTAPQALDISHLVRPGINTVEVRVANLWVNRLIGDVRTGRSIATVYGQTYAADAPLRPSGLLGPVRLTLFHR